MITAVSGSQPSASKLDGGRFLVCLDRSISSEVCVPYAVSLAKAFRCSITLLHVLQPRDEHGGPQTTDALGWEISRQEARGFLDRLERDVTLALGQPTDTRLEQGRPAERIVDVAREIEAELIVLGTRGEGEAPAWGVGSTLQGVLSATRSSVFVAHSSSTAPKVLALGRVLVPLDGSLRTESVLPAAARIASAHGAEMLLVHVVQEPLPTALLNAAADMDLARQLAGRLESCAKRYLEELQRRLAHEVPSVHTLVARHANARQCLLEVSRKEQVDLIVLSAHGSACDSGRSFGSVTTYLLTQSMVPMLVLQDLAEGELQRPQDVAAPPTPPSLRASYAPENG
jgi:nucleotide-binding universal stress UspA family protein